MLDSIVHRAVFALAILLPAPCAMAKDIGFEYVQADFILPTIKVGDSKDEIHGSGFGFSLSLAINQHLDFTLDVISATFRSFQTIEVASSKTTALGVTAHTSIAPDTEIFANLSVVKAIIETTDGLNSMNDDDIGSRFHLGLRYLLTERFELELGGSSLDVFGHSAHSYNVETRFYFLQQYSLGVGYVTSDNADTFLLNVRMDI